MVHAVKSPQQGDAVKCPVQEIVRAIENGQSDQQLPQPRQWQSVKRRMGPTDKERLAERQTLRDAQKRFVRVHEHDDCQQ